MSSTRLRRARRPLAIVSLACAAALGAPAVANAQDASPVRPLTIEQIAGMTDLSDLPALLPDQARPPTPAEFAAVQALFPAIIGTLVQPAAGSPGNGSLAQAKALLDNAPLPDEVKQKLDMAITFLDGSGGGGPDIPQGADEPVIQQFLFPTVGQGCIGGDQDSVGMALMTAGPQEAPAPGPDAGQAGFVFTALGTSGAQPDPAEDLMVSWINVDSGAQGTQPLTNAAAINQDGPTTLTAIADTGTGRIVATIYGTLTSKGSEGEPPVHCTVLPTIGLGVV